MVHFSEFRLDSRIQRQARALAQRGDEVDLVCIGAREELRVGAGVIRTRPLGVAKAQGAAGSYLRGYASFVARACARLAALDARRRFDVVEAHNMPDLVAAAALWPRLRGAPLILDVHDTFPELFATKFARAPGDPLVRLLELEERLSAALASRVVAVTEQARRRLEARGVGVGRTAVVMNSPDERLFGPPRAPVEPPGAGAGPLRVLYHGGLAERFGVESLIRAFGVLGGRGGLVGRDGPESADESERPDGSDGGREPELTLRICGSGEPRDRERLAALARAIDPRRIDVAPAPVPFAQIPAELARAHIGVVPTLHDRFTELLLPVKLLEYVHMGLPVVCSRLPCIGDYFGDGELRTFTPGDPEDLARALRDVRSDPAGARERAARATQALAPIAWERQREGYLALVDELAGAVARRW